MNMLRRWLFLLKRGPQTFTARCLLTFAALLWLRFAAAITSYFYACQIVSSSLQKEVCLPDTWLTMNMLCRHKFPGFFFSEGLIENVCPDICAPPIEQIFYPESLICCTSLWAIQLKLENNKDFYSNERNTEAQEKRYKRAIKKGRLTYFFSTHAQHRWRWGQKANKSQNKQAFNAQLLAPPKERAHGLDIT